MKLDTLNNYIVSTLLLVMTISCTPEDIPQAQIGSRMTLVEFAKKYPDRKIHAWGHGISRWESEAIPYFESMQKQPVVINSYLTLSDLSIQADRLQQFEKIRNGWTNPTSDENHPFIPLIGLTASFADFHARRALSKAAFFEELGITEPIRAKYQVGPPTYELEIFRKLAANNQLWEELRPNLIREGYNVADLDFQQLLRSGSDDDRALLFNLRDDILAGAHANLAADGALFEDAEIVAGRFDQEIMDLADLIKETSGPILIRLFFETYGGYSRPFLQDRSKYLQAYRHVVDLIKAQGVTNVEWVWHPLVGNNSILKEWYPGDEYVDWVGTSMYKIVDANQKFWEDENAFALSRGKYYLITESGPTDPTYRPDNINYPGIWSLWFEPFFNFIEDTDNLKLFTYINIDNGRTPDAPFADWGNTRVQDNADLLLKYAQRLSSSNYLHNAEFWKLFEQ